ncbi:hypothetical protein Dsin_011779 [Dipteronia sinensis]|uniref:Uncharacterized protein n=1 Tax=Dipteronia sinensis TaxID=43782 RepID=A0AAE0E7J9_9ROSI|nr:hypothetical protein Dsin_011779 [Dipteronia sinensis]
MVSEHKLASLKMSSSFSIKESKLNIKAFHQCSSLITAKLNTYNFLLRRSQIILLVCSLGLSHHLNENEQPATDIEDDKGEKILNPLYRTQCVNDGILISWLRGTIKDEVLSLFFQEADTTYKVWTSLEL